jgi:TRAP-type uncharacterized transport system substrate-binding protein
VLARDRIQLQLLASSGSIENLMRLRDESKPVDVGFVQGGIGKAESGSNLVSLASVFYSPLWVFYRGDEPLDDLSQLRGKRPLALTRTAPPLPIKKIPPAWQLV